MNCYDCYAKAYCMAAAEPGSVVCMINRMRYGGTHADDRPPRQAGDFCQYCGQRLRVIGTERSKTPKDTTAQVTHAMRFQPTVKQSPT